MKIALFLSLCTVVSAFTATKRTALSTSSLNVASTPDKMDQWSNYPLHVPESTTPVAARKVSKWERMTMADVVIPPDFSLSWAVAILGPLIMWYHPCEYNAVYNFRTRTRLIFFGNMHLSSTLM
jgi:hypothetical protein